MKKPNRWVMTPTVRMSSMLMMMVIIGLCLMLLWRSLLSIKEWYDSLDPMIPEIHRRLVKVHEHAKKVRILRGNKSYTLNKEKIYMCLYDENNDYYHINMLTYVAVHELAHCLCDEIGHTDKFFKIFHELLDIAEAEGVYDPNIPPVDNYCAHGATVPAEEKNAVSKYSESPESTAIKS